MNAARALRTVISALILTGLGVDLAGQQSAPSTKPTEEKTAANTEAKVAHWLAVTGGDVYLGNGSLLRRTTILVGDDKIHAIGQDVEIPEGAEILDASGQFVSPGFCIVKGSTMGAPRGTPSGSYRDELNPFDASIKRGLAAGITSFLIQSDTGSTTPAGKSAVIKLAFGDLEGMICAEQTALGMRVPLDPQKMRAFRKLVIQAREHEAKLADLEAGKKEPKAPKGTEPLLRIFKGEAKLWIRAARGFSNDNIRQAMAIAELLGVGVVLDNPSTAWVLPDEIATTGSMAVLNPREKIRADPTRPDTTGSNIASAAILSEVGVPVAVTPPPGFFGGTSPGTGGILGQDLNTPHIDAAYAVRGGLDNRKALRTITLDAAKIMGVEDRVGSIEVGKDADLLILDGDPLNYKTFVQIAIVNGKVVYEKDKEPFYRHIKR